MNKIALFTVVYPAIDKYLDSFLSSLAIQTYNKFDLFIANDGFSELHRYKNKYNTLNIYEIKCSGTHSQVRCKGFTKIQEKDYDLAIFGDADDYFAKDRIEKTIKLAYKYDIVVNDLSLVNEVGVILKENYLSKRLNSNQEITIDFIKDKNVFGLSNTAVNRKVIKDVIFEEDLIAIDWYLFYKLLSKGYNAVFTNETSTFYRQHYANTSSLLNPSKEAIKNEIKAKMLHYKKLHRENIEYTHLYKNTNYLYEKISKDSKYFFKYVEEMKKKRAKFSLWWENALIPENIRYENSIN